MKYLNIISGLALILLLAADAKAQRYVADNIYDDSIQAYEVRMYDGKELPGDEAFKIANGDTVDVLRALANDTTYAVFSADGRDYAISGYQLVLSDDNPEGTVDTFDYEEKDLKHSILAHLFATPIPYIIVAALMLLMIVFIYFGGRLGVGWKFVVIYIPAALLTVCVIEIAGARILGDSALWFVDNDDYGWWGKLFVTLPFIMSLGAQFFALKFYRIILFDDDDDGEKQVTVKPVAWSVGLFLPLAFVLSMGLGFMGIRGIMQPLIGIGLPFLGIVVGLIIAFGRNIRSVGAFRGIVYTIFSIIYCVGCVVAAWALVLAISHVWLQILISIAICGVLSGRYHEPTPEERAKMDEARKKVAEENSRRQQEYLERQRHFLRQQEREAAEKKRKGSDW